MSDREKEQVSWSAQEGEKSRCQKNCKKLFPNEPEEAHPWIWFTVFQSSIEEETKIIRIWYQTLNYELWTYIWKISHVMIPIRYYTTVTCFFLPASDPGQHVPYRRKLHWLGWHWHLPNMVKNNRVAPLWQTLPVLAEPICTIMLCKLATLH